MIFFFYNSTLSCILKNNDQWTALHTAAHHGQREAVRLLVEGGAGTSLMTTDGRTAILIAALR